MVIPEPICNNKVVNELKLKSVKHQIRKDTKTEIKKIGEMSLN